MHTRECMQPCVLYRMSSITGVVKTDLNRTREGSVMLNMTNGMECMDAAMLIYDALRRGQRYETWTFRAKALYLIRDILPDLRDHFWYV